MAHVVHGPVELLQAAAVAAPMQECSVDLACELHRARDAVRTVRPLHAFQDMGGASSAATAEELVLASVCSASAWRELGRIRP